MKGDRYYIDELVKIKLNTVNVLKKMNDSYPTSTSDYDKLFLFDLSKEIFTKKELRACGKCRSLMKLNRVKLKFIKEIFCERVRTVDRFRKFKELIVEIGLSI